MCYGWPYDEKYATKSVQKLNRFSVLNFQRPFKFILSVNPAQEGNLFFLFYLPCFKISDVPVFPKDLRSFASWVRQHRQKSVSEVFKSYQTWLFSFSPFAPQFLVNKEDKKLGRAKKNNGGDLGKRAIFLSRPLFVSLASCAPAYTLRYEFSTGYVCCKRHNFSSYCAAISLKSHI